MKSKAAAGLALIGGFTVLRGGSYEHSLTTASEIVPYTSDSGGEGQTAVLAGVLDSLQQIIAPMLGGAIVYLIPVVAVLGVVFGYISGRVTYTIQSTVASGVRDLISSARNTPFLLPEVPNSVFTTQYRIHTTRLYQFLALFNLLSLLGVAVASYIGRPRFLGMALIILFIFLLLDVIILSQSRTVSAGAKRVGTNASNTVTQPGSNFSALSKVLTVFQDTRLAVSALLLSIGALVTLGPGLVYFVLVALFVTVLVLNVYLAGREDAGVKSSLALLAVGAGIVLLAQTLTVPYYARTLDTLFHTTLARRIAEVGALAPKTGTRYSDLPVYHTLAAVYIQVLGGTARTVTALLIAGLFSLATAACYLIVRNITDSVTTGFVTAALLAVNTEFISWGVQSHVQSLSLFFMTIFLVLHTDRRFDIRFTALAAGIALVWTLTHHLSLFMAIVLIGSWNLAGTLWLLLSGYTDITRLQVPLYQYSMLTMFVTAYWILTGLYRVPIRWLTETSVQAQEGIPTTNILIQTYDSTGALMRATLPFLIDNLHYVFVLALGGYGLWTIVRRDGSLPSPTFPKVIVGFLFAALVYVPNPAWLFGRGVAALQRWGMMSLPFLLPMVGLGFVRLFKNRKTSVKTIVLAFLVLTTAFLSVGAGFSDPSLTDSVGYEKGATKYYTEGNLDAADHILTRTDDTTVSASHTFAGYLLHAGWTGSDVAPPERFNRFTVVDGQIEAEPGLTVVEEGTLEDDRVRMRVQVGESNEYQGGVDIIRPVSGSEIDIGREQRSVVYDNSDTVIMFSEPVPDE